MDFKCDSASRLDIFLCKELNISRNQALNLIKNKNVYINDKLAVKSGAQLKPNDEVRLNPLFSEIAPRTHITSSIEIERIYEDSDILVINKPPNLATHPAPSLKEDSLVEWLKAHGIQLSNISGESRAGIVHRLDKQTSGALVIAKNNEAHNFLSKQLQTRKMGRIYLAIIDLALKEDKEIECFIARHPTNRIKMAKYCAFGDLKKMRNLRADSHADSATMALRADSIKIDSVLGFKDSCESLAGVDSESLVDFGVDSAGQKHIAESTRGFKRESRGLPSFARYSKSNFYKLLLSNDGKEELIAAKLSTGRTHQIRVHLESINRHIIGDKLYGYNGKAQTRVLLHSYILYLEHPHLGKMSFKADIHRDMACYLQENFNMEEVNEKIQIVAHKYSIY